MNNVQQVRVQIQKLYESAGPEKVCYLWYFKVKIAVYVFFLFL